MEKIRVGTLCSGYDSQCLALERLKRDYPQFDYELMWWSDIDKYAIKAHNALFPQWLDRNLGDMTQIDWTKCEKVDLLFYSTPCQSISQAGLQHGFVEGSGTRSSIIWNVKDAITILRPKFAILENVSAMKRKYRIRKLTERECFRLQGVDDKDIDTIQAAGISKTQQYKMAGNSIVVDVLYHIFRKLLVETKADPWTQLELF